MPRANLVYFRSSLKRLRIAVVYAFYLAFVTASATWVGKITSSLSEKGSGGILRIVQSLQNPRGEFPGQDRINVLLVGKDYNRDSKGMEYTKNSRSDTIMMMSIDLDSKKIGAVSIPRDTKVRAPDGRTGKINGTFARGGIDLLAATLKDMFDVDFDYTVVIKPDAVKEIVDALGGVNVETIDEMNYDDNWGNLHIHLPKGQQQLTGEQAVGFTRFREINVFRPDSRGRLIPIRNIKHSLEEGDTRRMARQQQLIRAMMAAANHPTNLWRADQIINTGFKQLDTNFKRIQLMALATLMKGAQEGQMHMTTLEGSDVTENGAYYTVLDQDRAKATVDWIIKGDESAANKMVRVAVYNGSGVSGAARKLADKLKEEGFDARSVGNADTSKLTEVLYHKAALESRAKAISSVVGGGDVTKVSEQDTADRKLGVDTDDVIIVVGSDLAEKLVARA